MPRSRRIYLPDVSVHVMQRGNNKNAIIHDEYDCEVFLDFLESAARQCDVAVHGFVVMKNHYHLLATPGSETALPRAIQDLAGNYCRYFNQRYARLGTIWNGRYKPLLILDERYWLTCLRYIEQNPVRAKIVDSPEKYRKICRIPLNESDLRLERHKRQKRGQTRCLTPSSSARVSAGSGTAFAAS